MSDARSAIFERLRNSVGKLPEKAPYPEYAPEFLRSAPHLSSAQDVENFRSNFEIAHGKFFSSVDEFGQFLLAEKYHTGFCDPALREQFNALPPAIRLLGAFDRADIDACAFGITRAAGAIAESGTIILNDATTCNRLAALAPWLHLAVIPRDSLYSTISDAITAFGDDPNIVWATGPSKTADVEGILIEGVHGPGIQCCLFV